MIQLSTRLVSLLNSPVIETFYLVKISTFLLTSYPTNLEVPGKGLFLATDMIKDLDRLQNSSVVDRSLYTIELVDSGMTLGAFYEDNLVGADVEAYVGFVDYVTKQPELNDLFLAYKGKVESFGYKIDSDEQGEVTSQIICSNPMMDLDAVRPFYTSKDFLRQINVNDSAFDQVYQGSGIVNLLWGKS